MCPPPNTARAEFLPRSAHQYATGADSSSARKTRCCPLPRSCAPASDETPGLPQTLQSDARMTRFPLLTLAVRLPDVGRSILYAAECQSPGHRARTYNHRQYEVAFREDQTTADRVQDLGTLPHKDHAELRPADEGQPGAPRDGPYSRSSCPPSQQLAATQ